MHVLGLLLGVVGGRRAVLVGERDEEELVARVRLEARQSRAALGTVVRLRA